MPEEGKKEEKGWLYDNLMLKKENKLTQEKDFTRVFNGGSNKKTDFLVFKTLKNSLGESRFGFVVSKKFFKNAVERNKIKRRLKAAVFAKLTAFKKSLDVVIIALPGIEQKKVWEIQEIIFKQLRQ